MTAYFHNCLYKVAIDYIANGKRSGNWNCCNGNFT